MRSPIRPAPALVSPSPQADREERAPSIRELEVLRALVSHGKTTAAAAKLGITQPAVSRAIAQLEAHTGLVLFRREGGRLLATAEALALARESEPIFTTLERLERANWRPIEANPTLRVGCPPTMAQFFLTELLAAFSRAEPEMRLQFEIGSGDDVLRQVTNGDMDIGIVDAAPSHPGARFVSFRVSEAHVIVPKGSPWAGRASISPVDVADQPFIALARRFPSRTVIDRLLLGAGVTARLVAEVSTVGSACDLVEAGIGFTIANPFPVIFGRRDRLDFVPFRPAIAYETSFVLPSMVPPTPVARRFMDFVRANQRDDGISTAIR
jgi:DNA-binding transcriptional LysR family regulator